MLKYRENNPEKDLAKKWMILLVTNMKKPLKHGILQSYKLPAKKESNKHNTLHQEK